MTILSIPITKVKGFALNVETDSIPEDVYQRALEEGLKVLLNARMSKVGSVTKLEGKELEAAEDTAKKIANENLENIYAGKIGTRKSKAATGESREVMTEARRLAKEVVKNQIRASGKKISHVEPKVITEIANDILKADASYIEQAKLNIAARNAIPTTAFEGLESLFVESPKLVAKAEEAKAKKAAAKAKTTKEVKAELIAKAKPKVVEHHTH